MSAVIALEDSADFTDMGCTKQLCLLLELVFGSILASTYKYLSHSLIDTYES